MGPRVFLTFHTISLSSPTKYYYFNRHGVHWQITTLIECFPLKVSLGSVLELKPHIISVL